MIAGIPVNVIAGPLGVGKTTAINQLISQRPAGERWAVLINEYGLVGLDAALIDAEPSAEDIAVKEVAGGCICCSAGPVFQISLVQLLRRRPDRLIIEPTGLATLSGILDTLRQDGIREAVDLRSIICLLNPVTLERDLLRDEVRDQVEGADVLLASRADLASPGELDAFAHWAASRYPPRRYSGQIERGLVPPALLDLVRERESGGEASDDHHRHAGAHHHRIDEGIDRAAERTVVQASASTPIIRQRHQAAATTTIGWVCWAGVVFDAERIERWIESLALLPGMRRVKAVMHTSRGWVSFNLTDDARAVRPSAYRRDSRLEIIVESESPPDADRLEDSLRDCFMR